MRLRAALVVLAALVVAAGAYLHAIQRTPKPSGQPSVGAVDARTQRNIERLKSFDPERYAQTAAAANDFRHVHIASAWRGGGTPGIACLAELDEPRRLFFGDVRYPGLDQLERGLADAAKRFNTALLRVPNYPDKDSCILVDKRMSISDVAEIARAADRKPMIVDLATAVRAQDLAAAQRFLAAGADVNGVDRWRSTPLMWAIRRKNRALFDWLVGHGALIDAGASSFSSPLSAAVDTADASILRALLIAGNHEAGGATRRHSSNLHIITAIELNRIDLIDLLIEFGAVPAPDDSSAWDVPLGSAVGTHCVACIERILTYGGKSLSGTETVVRLLREELAKAPKSELALPLARAAIDGISYSAAAKTAMLSAINGNQPAALKLLLAQAQDVNFLESQEVSRLAASAAQNEQATMTAIFAAAATRRRQVDEAIERNDAASLQMLIADRSAIEQQHTRTPLMGAAELGRTEIVRMLLKLGADPNERAGFVGGEPTAFGEVPHDATALYFAVNGRQVDASRALVERGADPEVQVLLALATILRKSDRQTIGRFVDLFLTTAPSNRRALRANIMLRSAAESGDSSGRDLAELLLDRKSDPCADEPPLESALLAAAWRGTFETFRLMVKHCAGWSPTSKAAKSALQSVLANLTFLGNVDSEVTKTLRFLLEQRTPLPDDTDARRYLCTAVEAGNIEVVDLLLDAGANINSIVYERTALDCVYGGSDKERDAMRTHLRRRGAKTAAELGVKPTSAPFPF